MKSSVGGLIGCVRKSNVMLALIQVTGEPFSDGLRRAATQKRSSHTKEGCLLGCAAALSEEKNNGEPRASLQWFMYQLRN